MKTREQIAKEDSAAIRRLSRECSICWQPVPHTPEADVTWENWEMCPECHNGVLAEEEAEEREELARAQAGEKRRRAAFSDAVALATEQFGLSFRAHEGNRLPGQQDEMVHLHAALALAMAAIRALEERVNTLEGRW